MYDDLVRDIINLAVEKHYSENYKNILINAISLGYICDLDLDSTKFTKEVIDTLIGISSSSVMVPNDIVSAVSMLSEEMRRNSSGASKPHVVFVHKNKYKDVKSVFGVADTNNREVDMKLFGINVVISPYLDESEILMLANPKFTMMEAKRLVMLGVLCAEEQI